MASVDRLNVLFVCTDQQRSDWLGFDPDLPIETPAVKRLADRGRQFTDAVCPTPICNPCRANIVSGMEYDRCGVPNNEVDYEPDGATLYRRLRDEAGYYVAGCGKFDLTASYGLGMDGRPVKKWGFSDGRFTPAKNETVARVEAGGGEPTGLYTSYLAEEGLLDAHVQDYRRRSGEDPLDDGKPVATFPTTVPDEAYYDEWITRQGRQLIEDAPADRPWFLQVNLQNPHDPWDVTEPMHERFRDPSVEFPLPVHSPGDLRDETHQEVRRNYAVMVEHLDRCLDSLVEAVEVRDDREETLVIFTSDHGELLGDYGQ